MSTTPPPASAFKHPLFRSLWLAAVGSGIGGTIHDTAALWTLTLATNQAWMITLFQSLLSLPLFLLALPAGAVADLADKRRLMVGIQVAGCLVAAVMAILAWMGLLPQVVILVGAFVLGSVGAFGITTWQALVPEVIPKTMMASAITLGSVGINLARAIGPLVGGLLVAAVGPTPAFALNALSYLGLAVVLLCWHRPRPDAKPHAETMASAMIAAIRHLRHTGPIQRVFLRHGLFAFFAFAPVALLPILVKNLGLGGSVFGMLMGVYGLGGIIAALLVLPWLRTRVSVDRLVAGAGCFSLVATTLLPLAKTVPLISAILFPAGAAWLVSMSLMNFAGQSLFPHWVRARASALHLLAVQGPLAIGALLWGDLTSRFGTGIALYTAAGGLLLYLMATLRWRVDSALSIDLSPADLGHRHDHLALQPPDDAGPVRVTLHYLVSTADEPGFLKAMFALRDSRLRDGAYRWNLWRDLKAPNEFTEASLLARGENTSGRMNAPPPRPLRLKPAPKPSIVASNHRKSGTPSIWNLAPPKPPPTHQEFRTSCEFHCTAR